MNFRKNHTTAARPPAIRNMKRQPRWGMTQSATADERKTPHWAMKERVATIQFAIPPLFAWGGINAIVTAVGVSLLIFALIVVFAGVETKSKSLESITV